MSRSKRRKLKALKALGLRDEKQEPGYATGRHPVAISSLLVARTLGQAVQDRLCFDREAIFWEFVLPLSPANRNELKELL